MANCFIPNSIPETGRTSTISLRRSKKQNSPAHSLLDASSRFIGVGRGASDVQKRREAAALQGALRARKVRGWMLDVGRWTFSFSRRVKGAWWPSRSSKPSSPRKWQGRFDSYPLRHFKFDGRCLRFDLFFAAKISHQTSTLKHQPFKEGGDLDVA